MLQTFKQTPEDWKAYQALIDPKNVIANYVEATTGKRIGHNADPVALECALIGLHAERERWRWQPIETAPTVGEFMTSCGGLNVRMWTAERFHEYKAMYPATFVLTKDAMAATHWAPKIEGL